MTHLPPDPHLSSDVQSVRMGVWERVMGDATMPDVRMFVLTGAIVLGLLTTRAVRDFVHTDPVVQHDLAMLFGTGVDVDPSRLNAERDATRAPSADPMEWPAVEYRD